MHECGRNPTTALELARVERTRSLPSLEDTFRRTGGSPSPGAATRLRSWATEDSWPRSRRSTAGVQGVARERRGRPVRGRPRGLLPWLAGRRAGRAGGSGGARAGRESVGTASLRRAPRALGTSPTPPPPLFALVLLPVLPPVLPSPLPLRPPRPGSNILRRLEHARLENNTTFQKPFQERPVPEGKEPGLLLLF